MQKKCIVCNKKIDKGKRSVSQYKKARYCSRKCFANDKRITETIVCEECGKTKTRKKRSDGKGRFCSNSCAGRYAIRIATKARDFNGENNPAYKNGKTINTQGYVRLNTKQRINEHRYVMEQHLGRKLTPIEVVHHIDGDKTNNNINNLKLCKNQSEHSKIHYQESSWGLRGQKQK